MNLYNKQPRRNFTINPERAPAEKRWDWNEFGRYVLVIAWLLFGAVVVVLSNPTPCTNCR